MSSKQKFLDFLDSNDQVLTVASNDYNYTIVKVPYSDICDMLFLTYTYNRKISNNNKFEYTGFYDKERNKLYDIGYHLRKDILGLDWNDETYLSISSVLSEFNKKVCETVNSYVEDEKDYFYQCAGDYESNITERDVYRDFIENREEIKYEAAYNSSNTENAFEYIDKGIDYIYEIGMGYFDVYREKIGQRLIDIDKANELLKSIRENKNNPIHKRKEISNKMSEGNYGNVHVFVNKDNIEFDFKYDAEILKDRWDWDSLYTFNMSASDRRDFEKLFGKHKDFSYEDITKIEYRNKVVYEDLNFNKENNQVEELVI